METLPDPELEEDMPEYDKGQYFIDNEQKRWLTHSQVQLEAPGSDKDNSGFAFPLRHEALR